MAKDPQQAADNWVAAMQSPQTAAKYKQGISGYTGNPMAEAAKQLPKYLARVTEAVSSGKMAARLNAANPATWKQNALTIGASALVSGATKAKAKVLTTFQRLKPFWDQAQAAAAAVPDDGGSNAGKWQAAVQVMMAAGGRS